MIKNTLLAIFLTAFSSLYSQTAATALFHVLVVDNNQQAQEGENVIFRNIKDSTEISGTTNAEGKFDATLIQDEEYEVIITTFGKDDEPKILKVPTAPGKIEVTYTIQTYYIGSFLLDVKFESAKATLDVQSYSELDKFYEMLDLKRNMKVEIGGHTDNVGDDNYNLKLSQDRANTVKAYLVKKGITPERIVAKGYGETTPVATNETPEGRQKNRRTEVKIIQD